MLQLLRADFANLVMICIFGCFFRARRERITFFEKRTGLAVLVVFVKMEEIFVDILGDANSLVHLALDEGF